MSTTVAVHVPAWKRVGLKLKSSSSSDTAAAAADVPAKASEVKDSEVKKASSEVVVVVDEGEAEAGKDKKERKKKKKKKERKEKEKEMETDEKKDRKDKKVDKKSSSSSSSSEPAAVANTTSTIITTITPSKPPASASTPITTKSLLRTPSTSTLRKSVTFTSDTKATDGDSIKTLYQNHDPFAHYDSYQQHLVNYPTNELPAGFDDPVPKAAPGVGEVKYKFESMGKRKKFSDDDDEGVTVAGGNEKGKENGAKNATEKAKGKASTSSPETNEPPRKKRKKTKPSPSPSSATTTTNNNNSNNKAQLSYLSTYHHQRASWKFEKSKQNWILRHALDTALIPDTHAEALKGYISGLQSAAARDRLLEAANAVVKRGADTVGRDGERVNVEVQRVGVVRAKLVLAALGHGDDDDEEEEGSDSSSSSSSSSSDGDSGEE